jgi:hypothetical protein
MREKSRAKARLIQASCVDSEIDVLQFNKGAGAKLPSGICFMVMAVIYSRKRLGRFELSSFDAVKREIEDIVVVERFFYHAPLIFQVEWPR